MTNLYPDSYPLQENQVIGPKKLRCSEPLSQGQQAGEQCFHMVWQCDQCGDWQLDVPYGWAYVYGATANRMVEDILRSHVYSADCSSNREPRTVQVLRPPPLAR